MRTRQQSFWVAAMCSLLYASPLFAAHAAHDERAPYGMAMHNDMPLFHLLLEELEYGTNDDGFFNWDGQAWYGNDSHKLWLKSEGEVSNGDFEHGRHEILYDRPISTFFDLQTGLRADIDDNPGETWLALGVQGLAPGFFHVSVTGYANADADLAFNGEASFDLLLTQRLILQPKAELDLYTKSDAARGIGSGFSSLEGGIRLRYEFTRKFAPYIGVNYEQKFGGTKRLSIANDEDPNSFSFVFGMRAWI